MGFGPVSGGGSATIGAGTVTLAMLADLATARFIGRTTAGTGVPEALTVTQATAMLNVFGADSGAGGVKGLAPATVAGDNAKFLKGNGTYAAVDLTANVTGILPSANGGTANGFTKFSGASASEKTYTLPNASAAILTDNAAVTAAQGGTGQAGGYAIGDILYASGATALSKLADVATGNALISGGVTTAPSWGKITTSHTTGIAASGANADITSMTALSGNISTAAGNSLTILATAPAATTGASQAGKSVSRTASAAVASTDTSGAANGGGITDTLGVAARNTSGNANGGAYLLQGAAGIGTGTASGATFNVYDILVSDVAGTGHGYIHAPTGTGKDLFVGMNPGLSGCAVTLSNNVMRCAVNGTPVTYSTSFYAWTGDSTVTAAYDTALKRASAGVVAPVAASAAAGDFQAVKSVLTAATMTQVSTGFIRQGLSKYTWTNAQVVALGASTTGDIKVCTLPAGTVVLNAYIVISGTAAGTTTLTVSLGRTSAAYIDYIVASNAQVSANTVYGAVSGDRGTNLTGYDLPSYTATTDVYCHFISTVSNLSAVTGCTGIVYLETETII